jgi:hypothetical protein
LSLNFCNRLWGSWPRLWVIHSTTCGFMDLFLYINQPKSTLPLKGFDVNTGSLLRLLRYDHADN